MTRPAEIKALSGARALPPLMIVLYHYCTFHQYVPAEAVLGPPIMKGYLWVEFFFALSGFILIHVHGTRVSEFWRGRAYVPFLQARLARLYPVHLVTLLSILLLMGTLGALDHDAYVSIYQGPHAPLNTWPTFIANLFLVQAWNILPDLTWNAVAWFVSVEFLLCLLFPVFLLLARGGPWRGATLIAAGIAWLVLLSVPSHVGLDITIQNGIFRGMAGFAIGVGSAILYRSAMTEGAEHVPEWVYSAAQGALLVYLAWAIWLSGSARTASDIWTALGLDALVLALAFDRGFLARVFASPMLLRLGEWSYGIYMGQMFWMQLARYLEQRHFLPNGTPMRWLEPLAMLLVCIGWGALLAILIEQPANTRLRNLLAQRKQPGAA
jgi:peptidoglycan/LPS O-acetylase OafA/YrhL